MNYDFMIIKILLFVARILTRYSDKVYLTEIDKLKEEIFEEKEGK